jgi:hypothetical protein
MDLIPLASTSHLNGDRDVQMAPPSPLGTHQVTDLLAIFIEFSKWACPGRRLAWDDNVTLLVTASGPQVCGVYLRE